jgi:succinyl-CoA synthetase beta subunit
VKLQEHFARSLLAESGLPVPPSRLAGTPDEVARAAELFAAEGFDEVVVKAQVLVGGRGKAGGVRVARGAEEARAAGEAILALTIKGIPVRRVLVAPAARIVRELYLAAVLDRTARRILVMASGEGGVEIEEVARERPDAIVRVHAHPHLGLLGFEARRLALALDLPLDRQREFVAIAKGLVRVMTANDCDLVEVNPLAIVEETTPDGATKQVLRCLDAKITVDDSALPRHPGIEAMRDVDEEDPTDRAAREDGINYIRLDGNIGCIVNGAGLAMTTMDLIKRAGGEPANFLDIGGGARAERVEAALRLILADPGVEAVLVNIFGGITRGDEVAHGLIGARAVQVRDVPMVVRIVGTNADEAHAILADANFITATSLDEAAERAVRAAREHAAERPVAPRADPSAASVR